MLDGVLVGVFLLGPVCVGLGMFLQYCISKFFVDLPGWLHDLSYFIPVAAVLLLFVYTAYSYIPSVKEMWLTPASASIVFKDRDGRVILREGAKDAPPVRLDTLPAYVPNAVIAIEDRRFYKHLGIDLEGVARAAAANMKAQRLQQGGSTLTQQLVKNLFLTNDRTFARKATEIWLAVVMDLKLTKRGILELYLSRVYFGSGAYGIQAAAERYFDKPASRLTLAEAAVLAGLLKAPSRLAPIDKDRRKAAKARAKLVLDAMLEQGMITQKQHDEAVAAPLKVRQPGDDLGYFIDWIRPSLGYIIGESRADYVVETTLDVDGQRAGAKAMERALAKNGIGQGALVAMDGDGGVRAMIGGRSYDDSQFNRATQARRPPGSAFKYFVYLAAIEDGWSPMSVLTDAPVQVGDWAPDNHDGRYLGDITLTTAFAESSNSVAIQLADAVGHEAVLSTVKRLGVGSPVVDYPSLALGPQGVTPIELTAAYGATANGGYLVERPFGIRRVTEDPSGKVIFDAAAPSAIRVMKSSSVSSMTAMMAEVVANGTGKRAGIWGFRVAGKTGTSNDYRDAWFVGFSSGVTAGVWVGNDDSTPMKGVTGGSVPADIWRAYMTATLLNKPKPKAIAEARGAARVIEPEMVRVPGGRFVMGSPSSEPGRDADEGPQQSITIAAFEVGKYEVTFDEWDACVAGGGCNGYRPADQGWGRGRRPVINVSWDDAKGYVNWLNGQTGKRYRLLTEAEWEYAARAGTTTAYWTGNSISASQARFGSSSASSTAPVGSFQPNPLGLFDTAGNVWEWVEDCSRDNLSGQTAVAYTNGSCSTRVMRGGSWTSGPWASSPADLRTASRNNNTPSLRFFNIGFRLARTVSPSDR